MLSADFPHRQHQQAKTHSLAQVLLNLLQQPPEVRARRESLVLGGIAAAMLQSITGREQDGGSFDGYWESTCRLHYDRATGSPDIRDSSAFWIADIRVTPDGHMIVPREVADRVSIDFLKRSYKVKNLGDIELKILPARPARVPTEANRKTMSRTLRSAYQVLNDLADLELDDFDVPVSVSGWDIQEREYRRKFSTDREDARFAGSLFQERPRTVSEIRHRIRCILITFVRDVLTRIPDSSSNRPYIVMSTTEIRETVVGIAPMCTTDLSPYFRTVQVRAVDRRAMFDIIFPNQRITSGKKTHGHNSWGSLDAYWKLLANLSTPHQRVIVREAIFAVFQRFAWVPWANTERIWDTHSTSDQFTWVGLHDKVPCPRIAVFAPEVVASIAVKEQNRAPAQRALREKQKQEARVNGARAIAQAQEEFNFWSSVALGPEERKRKAKAGDERGGAMGKRVKKFGGDIMTL